jgi:pimeloyl-ACP methyl ester carboxylesterase
MQIVKLKNGSGINVQILNPDGKEAIILLHGMFGNMAQLYLTIAPFIARQYKVVLFDLKSQGRSDRVDTGYSLQIFAEELMELADELALTKVHLLGYSFGALIALKCGMEFPERIGKIIAIEVPDKSKDPFCPRGAYTYEYFQHFVTHVHAVHRENFFRNKRQMQNHFLMHEYIFNHTSFSEDMNNEEEFQQSHFEKIKAPVLLAFGQHSICFSELERIKDWIPCVDIYIEEGGHDFFLNKVEKSSARILKFLNSPQSICKAVADVDADSKRHSVADV